MTIGITNLGLQMAIYQSKQAAVQAIRNAIRTNTAFAFQVLNRIYQNQTKNEQDLKNTQIKNNQGFNYVDAEICSSLAEQLAKKKFLSAGQIAILHKVLPRYAKQYLQCCVADETAIVEGKLVFSTRVEYWQYKEAHREV